MSYQCQSEVISVSLKVIVGDCIFETGRKAQKLVSMLYSASTSCFNSIWPQDRVRSSLSASLYFSKRGAY